MGKGNWSVGLIIDERAGLRRSVSIPKMLEQSCAGVASVANSAEPLYVDNTIYPGNTRLALAKATASHLHAFGLDWDDTSATITATSLPSIGVPPSPDL